MEIKTLGELCNIVSGGTPLRSKPEYWNNGTIPWIKIGDMKGKYINSADECITQAGLDSSSAKMLPKGTILYTIFATLGEVGILEINASTNQAIAGLTIKDNSQILSEYLYYYLKSKKGYVKTIGRGVAQSNINMSILKSFQVPLPTSLKQKEIVDILDKITNIIKYRQQELHMLDNLIKARFVELFGDQTTNPYGWQKASIGACCTLKSGTSLPADKENEGGAIPYVKVSDMNYPGNEQYITTSSRFVSEQTAGTGVFPVGTVVFPKRGGAIGTNKKRLTRIPICADLNVMGVTAGIRLTPQYLMAYFSNIDLGTLNNGSSVPQINNKDIAPLLICLPPMVLQQQFAEFVTQVDKSKIAFRMQVISFLGTGKSR